MKLPWVHKNRYTITLPYNDMVTKIRDTGISSGFLDWMAVNGWERGKDWDSMSYGIEDIKFRFREKEIIEWFILRWA